MRSISSKGILRTGLDPLNRVDGLLQFVDQIGNLAGASGAEVLERDASTAPEMKNRDVAGNAELHPVRYEVDFDMGATLKVDGRRFDEASGETEIEDSAAEQ